MGVARIARSRSIFSRRSSPGVAWRAQMFWLNIPGGTPEVVTADASCTQDPRSCALALLPIGPSPFVVGCCP